MTIKTIRVVDDAGCLKASDEVAVLHVEDAEGGETGVVYDGLERINIRAVNIADVYSVISCWLHSLEFVFGGETLVVHSSCKSASSSDVAFVAQVLLPDATVEDDGDSLGSPAGRRMHQVKPKVREVSHV